MISFVVGHSHSSPGAQLYNLQFEYEFNHSVVQFIQRIADPKYFSVVTKSRHGKAGNEEAAQKVAALKADHVVELHVNAFNGKTKVLRSECLFTTPQGAQLAEFLLQQIKKSYTIPPGRTESILTKGLRGFANLKAYNDVGILSAVILEPCFGDTENESSRKIIPHPEIYAQYLVEWMGQYHT